MSIAGLCPLCKFETMIHSATEHRCTNEKCLHSIQPFKRCTDCGGSVGVV